MADTKKQPEDLSSPEKAAPPAIAGVTTGPSPTVIPETVQPKGSESKVKILLKADYWPEENDRKLAGETIDVPKAKARELIREGKAELSAEILGDDD